MSRRHSTTFGITAVIRRSISKKIFEHPAYDSYWQEQALDRILGARPLKVPTMLLIPGAIAMEAMLSNPIATPDEINTIQLDNVADGIDSVSAHYGWRPTRPSTWAQEHWKKTRTR